MVEQRTENPRVVGSIPTGGTNADLAHLVERRLAKAKVAGSSPVIRSIKKIDTQKGVYLFYRTDYAVRRTRAKRSFAKGELFVFALAK